MGLLKKIQKKRPDLRLIVASATLDAEGFRDYFSDSGARQVSIVSVEGRQFPVDVHFVVDPVPCYLQASKEAVVHLHAQEPLPGDVLVFVSGQEEVQRLVREISEIGGEEMRVLPLHGSLPNRDQIRAFERPPRGVRKIVVATNVAETSLTIPGIAYVVDTGFGKIRAFNADTGLEALILQPISKASADQRAGRAGRVRAGTIIRSVLRRFISP